MQSTNVATAAESSAVEAAPTRKSLTFWEGVAMIVGTNIGAGVLSIAYA
jgi:hypothetical protein